MVGGVGFRQEVVVVYPPSNVRLEDVDEVLLQVYLPFLEGLEDGVEDAGVLDAFLAGEVLGVLAPQTERPHCLLRQVL